MPGLINPQQVAQPQQSQARPQPQQPQPPRPQVAQQPQAPTQPSPAAAAALKAKTFQMQKIVLSAQKVMYSEKTRKHFMENLGGEDVVQMASDAATTVMLILISESKFKINPELIIPAGVLVIGDILDFIEKTKGLKHTDEEVEMTIETFIKQIMSAVGGAQQAPPQQQGQPAQPQQPAPPSAQPTGGMM